MTNALKFTKELKSNVRIVRNDGPSSSEAVVYKSDSGQRIDAKVMNKLFEKVTSKSEKGTGLGLFISKSIVEAHRGKIYGQKTIRMEGELCSPSRLPLAT